MADFQLTVSMEPHQGKTSPTQTCLHRHRSRLETRNFLFKEDKNDCTVSESRKYKITDQQCITVQLIPVFVFAYAKGRISHDAVKLMEY